MQIPIEILILILWPVATALIVGLLIVEDRIVRHVCRKEGIPYSILWLGSSYWHWRIFKLSWFAEAREAGYFRDRLILYVAWICAIVIVAVAAGGLIAPAPSGAR
jgi:hypothetical protein